MKKRFALSLTGVVGLILFAACAEKPDVEDAASTEPLFAPTPRVCDTKDLSKAARDFFPRAYDKQGQELISALADACAAEPLGEATDAAFDVMALMEAALDGSTGLDPVAGASIVTGLLPFMSLTGCEATGCVVVGFAGDILLALSERGAFAVRGGAGDPTADVVSRDAEDPGLDLNAPAVWGLRPGTTWSRVLGQRALLYGHPEALFGGCDTASQDCPATDEQYAWETLPDVDGFGSQMIVGSCLVIDDAVVTEEFLRVRRNTTALEQAAGFDACEFLPAQSASLLERAFDHLLPWPRDLVAGNTKAGPGGNASDFSDFTPLNSTNLATLEISAVADGRVDQLLGPISVTARTANGTPLERVQVVIAPENNNGSWTATYESGGTASCGDNCRYTEEEGGMAVFAGVRLDKPGGYRVCATVKDGGNLGFDFSPAKVCSNQLNVRP